MKLAFAAGALTLMTIAGISSTPAAAQWRGGYSHGGYGHRAHYLGARGYGYGMRRYGAGYARGYGGYGYARRGYGGGYGYATRHYGGGYGPGYADNGYSHNSYSHNGYSHSAAYTAGFNRGAEAQWLVNMRTRWAYDYAVWRQINGPTGIFAGFGGGAHSYGHGDGFGRGNGLGHRFGGGYGYAGGYGNGCNC